MDVHSTTVFMRKPINYNQEPFQYLKSENYNGTNDMNQDNKNLLNGIKVVELTTMVFGPAAGVVLSDFGADVVKIEPLEGELMRKVGTTYNGMTNSFLCCNRSKRSLTLNLKNKKAINILKRLISISDVFIQNFRPGAFKKVFVLKK